VNELNFVRGMAWHDLAKPFFQGNPKHSRAGFLLLAAAGYREEGTVALCHIAGKDLGRNLEQYRQLNGPPLPALLLLCSPLDRLAASTYSFMTQGFSDPAYHAWHNPFTHLPEMQPQLHSRFQARDLSSGFEAPLRAHLLAQTPTAWQMPLNDLLERSRKDLPLVETRLPVIAGKNLLDLLLPYSETYPERTYAPVNDTLLSAHTRLSAVLAWVVYRNLKRASKDILNWTLTLETDTARLPDSSDAIDFVSLRDKTLFSAGEALVRDHIGAQLVRISLSGHRQWTEEAARLDDLKGAQQLTALLRTALKRAITGQLGVVDLADFLWLSESTFDLVYLLPEAVADPLELIQAGYDQALAWLVDGADNPDSLQKLLEADFRAADPPLDLARPRALAALKAELACLGYSVSIEPVQPPQGHPSYGAFTAAFGQRLLEAYRNSLNQSQTPSASLQTALKTLTATEPLAAEEVCSICSTHPVYRPLADRVSDDYFLRKVTHTFRDDPEQPCLSCIARRALAHKQVQVEALHRMIRYDPVTGRLQTGPATDPPMDVPPLLLHTGRLTGLDDYLDLRAAFVRRARRTNSPHPLDIFPTVSYAADSLGNIALLTLQASQAVFAAYSFRSARQQLRELDRIKPLPPVWKIFAEDYDAFCNKVAAEAPHLLDQVEVIQPHLARVLAREARLSHFFEDVAPAFEAAGIRVLALETRYPVGRWLIPAMLLPQALKHLGQTIAVNLLALPDSELDDQARQFLKLAAPPLLDGSIVVFKQKYPIYLVLEAARTLQAELGPLPAAYGLRLGLTDLRGILSSTAPRQALVTLDWLPELLALNDRVDRRSVTLRAADLGRASQEGHWAQAVADARLFIRSGWWGLPETEQQKAAEALTAPGAFEPILFFKTMSRE